MLTLEDLRELDTRGEPAPLDAEPAPVRVALSLGSDRLAVTVAPLDRAAHVAVLRDLDAPAGAPAPPLLLYLALQRARVWRRSLVVSAEPALAHGPLDMPLSAGAGLRGQTLDLALHRLWAALDPAAREVARARLLPEAVATLRRRAREFAGNAWCRAAFEGRLGRAQYIAALANTHQYVRYTPRLLARAIAMSEDEALRDHFYRHLRGEQKHDHLLEADLRYLGADVDFIVRAMAPSPATLAFMAAQESMVAFHQDPARFLAAPFVAEGIVAYVDPDLFVALAASIRRWGYAEPAKAPRFLAAHVDFDGGEDGHIVRTAAALTPLLRDDPGQQRFLAVLHLAADAFTRSYDGFAADFDLSFAA